MNEQEIERRLVALEKTVEKLRSSLFPLANGDMPPPNISRITSIQWLCANEYGITISDMLSRSREERYVVPRMLAMYLSRHHAGVSYTAIARRFGKKCHGTVMHAIRSVSSKCETDKKFRAIKDKLAVEIASWEKDPIVDLETEPKA
jgi:chromosomal replication initiation ATPase DnaA